MSSIIVSRAIRNYVRWLISQRIIVTMLVVLVTTFFVVNINKISFDSSIETWFLKEDPDLAIYQDFLDQFEADEIAVVGVFAEDVFRPDVLNMIDRLSRALQDTKNVRRVISISTVNIPYKKGEVLGFAPLLPEPPITLEQATKVRKQVFASEILRGTLISEDGRAAAIVLEIEHGANNFEAKVQLVRQMRLMTEREELSYVSFRLAGIPVLDEAFFNYSKRDFQLFLPLAILLVMVIAYLAFRRLSAAILPITVVALTLIWVFGIMALSAIKITVVTTALGVLILAVGVADSVHVLSEYYARLSFGDSRDQAIENAVSQLFTPCFFTSTTTAVGLLALLSSNLAPLREFGMLAALGVFLAFVLTMTYLPIALRFFPVPNVVFLNQHREGAIGRTVTWMVKLSAQNRRIIVVISAFIVISAVWGISKLQVGANPLNYFPQGDPVREDALAVDVALGGSATLEFLVRTSKNGLTEPKILNQLQQFQNWLEQDSGFGHSLSIVDTLKEMNQAIHDDNIAFYQIPNSAFQVNLYYLLMDDEEDLRSLIGDNYDVARITARGKLSEGHRLSTGRAKIEKKLEEIFTDSNVDVQMTGLVKLMNSMEKYLLSSQIMSFAIAFILITLLMFFILGSIRLGLFSMIPNLLPVFMALGAMGITGIALDPGTVMISCIALGLVVDDSVHFLTRMQRERAKSKSLQSAIEQAIAGVGHPIVITSIALAGGFLVLTFGSFSPNVYFGIVSAAVVLLALLADLLLLPALLLIIQPRQSPKTIL